MNKRYHMVSNIQSPESRADYVQTIIGSRNPDNQMMLIILGQGIEIPDLMAKNDSPKLNKMLSNVDKNLFVCYDLKDIEFVLSIAEHSSVALVSVVLVTPELFQYDELAAKPNAENFGLPLIIKSDLVRRVMCDWRVSECTLFID